MSRMLDEIRQQPEALQRTLSGELRRVERFKRLVEKNPPRLIVLHGLAAAATLALTVLTALSAGHG